MRRLLINFLALVGALSLAFFTLAWSANRAAAVLKGKAIDGRNRPIAGAAVFLDRGFNTIERYAADSLGDFELPLFPLQTHRATWLICAQGFDARVGRPELDQLGGLANTRFVYELNPVHPSAQGTYRTWGWKGPIPRECPQATDTVGWRYPASAGRGPGAFTTTEPDWLRYPGPPELPATD